MNYTNETIVVYLGIITKFGVIKHFVCDEAFRIADAGEVNAYYSINNSK